jgi:hypothetical protein
MCKELNEEIQRGEQAIQDLAKHLIAMGATNWQRTIPIDNQLIKITVEVTATAP